MRKFSFLCTTILITPAASVLADNVQLELPSLVIQERQDNSLTSSSLKQAEEKLDAIPGGTSLVDKDAFRDGAVRDIADALKLTPGVFSQSRFGSEETRLSVRGSGISLTFNTRGIRLLRDGLPLNEADGNFRPQLLEPLTAQHIEVYRGANALDYGAATLGGAINIISPNARTLEGFTQRLEGGSDAYGRFQATAGKVFDDNWDVFGSLTGITQDGFRDNANQDTLRFYGNTGYRWNEGSESRIHLNIQENNLELPGSLTQSQLREDPSQANPGSELVNSQRDFDLYRISAQHSTRIGSGGRADFGLSFQHLDFYHPLRFALLEADQNDWTVSTRVQHTFGERNELVYGGLFSWGESNDSQSSNFGLPPGTNFNGGPVTQRGESRSWNVELFFQDTFILNDSIDLIAGTQAIFARRESDERDLRSNEFSERDEDYYGLSPRIGVIWHASQDNQIFANISRSFEAPTSSAFAVDLDDTTEEILDEQTAITYEIGTRGRLRNINYELALYYSDINNEILTVENPLQQGDTITSNADDTVHKGVELGINNAPTPWLDFALAYTYNDFEFDSDSLYGNNEIPGIPRQFANVQIMFHTRGFSIGPTIQWADNHYVDFANSVRNDSYVTYGMKAGYRTNDHFNFFFEARNLADNTYASNTSTAANLNSDPDADDVFNPGIDRSFFFGIEYTP